MFKNTPLAEISEIVKTPNHIVEAIIYFLAMFWGQPHLTANFNALIDMIATTHIAKIESIVKRYEITRWWQSPGTFQRHLIALKRALMGRVSKTPSKTDQVMIIDLGDPAQLIKTSSMEEIAGMLGIAASTASSKWHAEFGATFMETRMAEMKKYFIESGKNAMTDSNVTIDKIAKEWNIEINTAASMIARMYQVGEMPMHHAEKLVGKVQMRQSDIDEVIRLAKNGTPYSEIMSQFNVSVGAITRYLTGRYTKVKTDESPEQSQ